MGSSIIFGMSEMHEWRPLECVDTRRTIRENIDWINNTDFLLEDGELGYEDQQTALNLAILAVWLAYDHKPNNCRMIKADDLEVYTCKGCDYLIKKE